MVTSPRQRVHGPSPGLNTIYFSRMCAKTTSCEHDVSYFGRQMWTLWSRSEKEIWKTCWKMIRFGCHLEQDLLSGTDFDNMKCPSSSFEIIPIFKVKDSRNGIFAPCASCLPSPRPIKPGWSITIPWIKLGGFRFTKLEFREPSSLTVSIGITLDQDLGSSAPCISRTQTV